MFVYQGLGYGIDVVSRCSLIQEEDQKLTCRHDLSDRHC